MGNIVLLDDLTINKIAAGEVIERPASVVKEMIENSIDAGATNINIEIKNGGISYIRISDNGKGIQKDDMEIAFERHATSKIRSASDLDFVKSMGFRGEALASIASIAHVEMISKTEEDTIGNKIVVEAGKTLEFEETACSRGTTITVTNLFFNTPVRYKFLKKDFTEAGYIEDVVSRVALVNPDIAIKLVSAGKTVIQTSGNGKLQDVIYGIYGKDIASSVLDVDYKYENMLITGVVGKPEIARSNRSNQIFFVNKRYIKDKILTGATEKAFKGMIPIGKFGFVILNIEMEQAKVDVNVHPAKLEVRFEEESNVFKAIYHAIQDTLLKSELVASPEREIEDKKEAVEEIKKTNTFSNLFNKITNGKNVGSHYSAQSSAIDKASTEELVQSELLQNSNNNPNIIEEMYNERKLENKNVDEIEQKTQIINTEEIKEKYNIENNNTNVASDAPDVSQYNQNDTSKLGEETPDTSIGNILTDLVKMKADLESNTGLNADIPSENVETNKKVEQLNNLNIPESFERMYEKTFGEMSATKKEKIAEEKKEIDAYDIISDDNKISVFEESEKYNVGSDDSSLNDNSVGRKEPIYKIVGIAFKTYIIIEIEDEMYIIDQHAAHERIMYEKIKKNYYSDTEKESQLLLLPDVITLTHKEMDIARDNMDIFRKAGFEIEEFGENTIKLNGVPPICYDLDTKELFLETLDEINTVARTAKQEIEERFIATVACKSAVKAHMALDNQEVEKLLDELLKLPNPFTCPHGRPTAIKMDLKDIEKKFARRK